ncbi:MAG: ATP-dependent helicase [Helicobacteraceae bacterium]
MNFLNDLNPAQRQAVLQTEGAVLILAGAGTGKTKTITARLAYLLANGILPQNTLTLTFTNKAAKEMRQRAIDLLEREKIEFSYPPMLFTFHKFGLLFLREHMMKLGRDNNFVIIDSDDKKRIIKTLMDGTSLDKGFVRNEISYFKTHLISPELALKSDVFMTQAPALHRQLCAVYQRYEDYLRQNNLVDFDDLLKLPYEILSQDDELRRELSQKYQYIMIDEFQDTNELQFLLIKELCSTHNNLCVVGDDDQSIYSWRGANVKNIIEFDKGFANTTVVKLEENYRSTAEILKAANLLIAHNKKRHQKSLVATKENGREPLVNNFNDEREESAFISKKVKGLINSGVDPKEIAVLYRINALSRSIEEGFLVNGINFNIVDSLRFYERQEVKDAISYLRVIVNPSDDFSFKRVINRPKRGLGKASLERLEELAARDKTSLFEAVRAYGGEILSKKTAQLLEQLVQDLLHLGLEKSARSAEEFIELFEERIRLKEYYLQSKEEERSFNIEEFYSALIDFISQKDLGIEDFLSEITLQSDQDKVAGSLVNLMSIHASKGLEFDYVFIIGLEEGFFPMTGDGVDLEEERRLGYVAFTRAKRELFLNSVKSRLFRGKRQPMEQSRFLKECGLVEGRLNIESRAQFKKGDLVKHKLFGIGRVVEVAKMSKECKLKINFGGIFKEILSNFLEKIN